MLFVVALGFLVRAQKIELSYFNQPLSDVLVDLHNSYGLEFSFNSTLVSNCKITINGTFTSLDKAIEALSIPCDIQIIKSGNIYILKNTDKQLKAERVNVIIGKIIDKTSKESLPFTQLRINGTQVLTNLEGVFTYRTPNGFCHIETRHLGYFEHDTTIQSSGEINIELEPAFTPLNEVVIKTNPFRTAFTNQEPFTIKTNNKTAILYPGSSDNVLFSMLRLQAGVLAAGEQTKDYIVQGSYRGQTQVNFEDITLFGTGTYNEYIGVVNPLMIKDIEIKKSGYNTHMGDRVGGWVNITALDGNKNKPAFNVKLNNQTLSAYTNIPVLKRSTLQLATRQTYYHLYNDLKIPFYQDVQNHKFSDYNIKFNSDLGNGAILSVNAIAINEMFKLEFGEKKFELKSFESIRLFNNRQNGISSKVAKTWRNGGLSTLTTALSSYTNQDSSLIKIRSQNQLLRKKTNSINSINLITTRLHHQFPSIKRNQLSTSLSHEVASSIDSNKVNRSSTVNRWSLAISNKYTFSPKLNLTINLRSDMLNFNALRFQPRFLAIYNPSKDVSFYTSAGIYQQYYSNDAFIDENGNYIFKWVSYNNKARHTSSRQALLGNSIKLENVLFRVEAYYKNTTGLNRWYFAENNVKHYSGTSYSRGVDVSLTRSIKKLEYGINYTLSKTIEHFDYFKTTNYKPAPQDQRHELKTHAVAYLGSFILSANYVYGSGLYVDERISKSPYRRADVAAMYRFKIRHKWHLETGISVLNVFNTLNFRPNYFISYQEGSFDVPTGVPFTPTLFLNVLL